MPSTSSGPGRSRWRPRARWRGAWSSPVRAVLLDVERREEELSRAGAAGLEQQCGLRLVDAGEVVEVHPLALRLRQRRLRVHDADGDRDLRLAAGAPPRPVVVLALFLGAGVSGALRGERRLHVPARRAAATRRRSRCWRRGRCPTCGRRARASYYEGDLLGAGAAAALRAGDAVRASVPEASWLRGRVSRRSVLGARLGRPRPSCRRLERGLPEPTLRIARTSTGRPASADDQRRGADRGGAGRAVDRSEARSRTSRASPRPTR